MKKEGQPRYKITGKKKRYKEIGDGLAEHDKDGFYALLGRPEFRDALVATDEHGRPIVEGLDRERMVKFLEENGFEEG